MVRTIGKDAPEQKVIDDIARYGWHCVNVLADDRGGPFSFTIGVFQTYRLPELVIFGLPSIVAHQVLAIVVEKIQSGTPLDMSAPTDELLENYPCLFIPVPESAYENYLGFCLWYYQGQQFPMCQIVWPSREGHFPWHPETSESFRADQPVLGQPPAGKSD